MQEHMHMQIVHSEQEGSEKTYGKAMSFQA